MLELSERDVFTRKGRTTLSRLLVFVLRVISESTLCKGLL